MTRVLSRNAIAKAYSATTVLPADVCAATSTEWPAGVHVPRDERSREGSAGAVMAVQAHGA